MGVLVINPPNPQQNQSLTNFLPSILKNCFTSHDIMPIIRTT
ncbi:hypothetical protein EJK51_1518 [Moraxella catarrhalis]|uniref:Uncharacterized protein n=1 Tax=Moraxella catarrhalis TaxID=480 RepID=A0A3Q9GGG4_MORCA|nr:hypothetical protein EJK52_1519 [Moraxella catarrhalis]AZQ89982.1 hypothetical protein EJK50_1585 [Moraxella catarrhalis]AZQ91803.1 hypothetical protein EJK51_1518 [Moraxella catarrhalis]AZQ92682.1 hypothetical protein EJK53_1774 [Moraxella catarrhalis]